MKILIVHDGAAESEPIATALAAALAAASITDATTTTGECPATDGGGDWSAQDVVLIVDPMRAESRGFVWPAHTGGEDTRPAIIALVADNDDSSGTATALGSRIDHVMAERDLARGALAGTIRAVIDQRIETVRRRMAVPSRKGLRWRKPVHAPPSVGADTPDGGRAPEPKPPVIEGYRMRSQIGRGALSRVYLAERQADGLTVVLKVIDLDLVKNHAHVRRFVREAELISALDSPHVVHVFEQGFTEDSGFIAMEFFPRGDLKQRIEYGLSAADALHCLANVAYGLEAIHKVGIVHRDLKPANVMFRHDDTLALADFGISKTIASSSEFVVTGMVLGTPHYMSPEQGQGKAVDVRDDIYSLGIVFFEMLTGEKPYTAENPLELVRLHVNAEVPKLPHEIRRYQGLVDRLLAKDINSRFQSAGEVLAAL